MNKYYLGEQFGNFRPKRARVNNHYCVVMENGQFTFMGDTLW